ncbi:hypothetical protein EJ08DRAFT_21710 [Tothia fuscella]|uniref:F-box domain-containing protein n=1 Tax=Tothia fuscella TaxID=1048955 RepID=A0A9P4NX74_9PEZI|nr:hypothetical protein EJ08DRAFT_21710 [Tothia fuscella]
MELGGRIVPEELLCSNIAGLANEDNHDDLRLVRLVCKTFARIASTHLFKTVPFSTDPEDWKRITSIADSPNLSSCVRRVHYRNWIYQNQYRDWDRYLIRYASDREQCPKETISSLDSDDNPLQKSLRRGFEIYPAHYHNQQQLLGQYPLDLDAPDLNLLMHAFKHFPNLNEFVISNPVFPLPRQTDEKQSLKHTLRTTKGCPPGWFMSNPGDPEHQRINLTPMRCATTAYLKSRYSMYRDLDGSGSDARHGPRGRNNCWSFFDPFALAACRGFQLLGLAARTAGIQLQTITIVLSEGVPLVLHPPIRTPHMLYLDSTLKSTGILSCLRKFDLEINCTTQIDAEFLKSGFISKVLDNAPSLESIRIYSRYDLSNFRRTGISIRRYLHYPKSGWTIPLEAGFGTSTFSKLRSLEIDWIFGTKSSFLSLLRRHKANLISLSVSGLAGFRDHDGSGDPNLGSCESCEITLSEIGELGLCLKRLKIAPGVEYDRKLRDFMPEKEEQYWEGSYSGPRYIKGSSRIQEFLSSGGVLNQLRPNSESPSSRIAATSSGS